jgi:1-acyl-sn-glycerol-3-phosphate acyltransferase
MLRLLKALVFGTFVVFLTLFMGFFFLPALFWHKLTIRVALAWCKAVIFLSKIIYNITVEVEGYEQFRQDLKSVILAKHVSAWETLYLFYLFDGDLRFILKKELFYIPIFGWFLYKIGMIGIDRSSGLNAIKSINKQFKTVIKQHNVLIFPQGTRVKYDKNYSLEKYPYKRGVLAIQKVASDETEFVPCINNSHEFFGRGIFSLKKSGKIQLIFLKKFIKNIDNEKFISHISKAIEEGMVKIINKR